MSYANKVNYGDKIRFSRKEWSLYDNQDLRRFFHVTKLEATRCLTTFCKVTLIEMCQRIKRELKYRGIEV